MGPWLIAIIVANVVMLVIVLWQQDRLRVSVAASLLQSQVNMIALRIALEETGVAKSVRVKIQDRLLEYLTQQTQETK